MFTCSSCWLWKGEWECVCVFVAFHIPFTRGVYGVCGGNCTWTILCLCCFVSFGGALACGGNRLPSLCPVSSLDDFLWPGVLQPVLRECIGVCLSCGVDIFLSPLLDVNAVGDQCCGGCEPDDAPALGSAVVGGVFMVMIPVECRHGQDDGWSRWGRDSDQRWGHHPEGDGCGQPDCPLAGGAVSEPGQ